MIPTNKNERPNISVPDGCEMFFNETTGRWALRQCPGFSAKYLKKRSLIPHSPTEEEPMGEPLFEDNNTKKISKGHNNESITRARRDKNDDFYTRIEDIEEEMWEHRDFLKGKIIYCPCDKGFNIGRSEFVNYFTQHFHTFGLKKVIFTQYNPDGVGYKAEWDLEKCGYKWEYNGEYEDNKFIDESEIDFYPMKGNGSFDSKECKEIMKGCDVVITNPPFSRFRDFINQIISLGKHFIIIGPDDAITYKEVFPLILNNRVWLGYSRPKAYKIPADKADPNDKTQYEVDGVVYKKFGKTCWYTNIEHKKRIVKIPLTKRYTPEEYPKYDNYDAIEVGSYKDIPVDYDGIMGVPISYLEHYNPNQFQIVGGYNYSKDYDGKTWNAKLFGKYKYKRLLIKKVSELPEIQ